MKFLKSPEEIESELGRLICQCAELRWAVAWASHGFKLLDLLAANQTKIRQLTVGTHFYQTHPDFIALFINHSAAHFVMNPSGVFHPKLYLFEYADGGWECITGSPNFTHAALSTNTEYALLLGSNDSGTAEIHSEIRVALEQASKLGKKLSDADLTAYRSIWKRQQKRLGSLCGSYSVPEDKKGKSKRSPLDVPLFIEDWSDYFESVKEDREHTTEGRLAVLEEARNLFGSHRHFSELGDEARKGIAGFGRTEELDWLWFGSMKGAGYFKQAINSNNQEISAALDEMPLTGEVTEEHFIRYLTLFRSAFEQAGIATATRLLALKRPDYFVCLDSKNRDKLCEAFDIPKSVGLDDYWEKVVQRITDSNWWNSPEPQSELERRVWRCRAAFLDVRFYDPA